MPQPTVTGPAGTLLELVEELEELLELDELELAGGVLVTVVGDGVQVSVDPPIVTVSRADPALTRPTESFAQKSTQTVASPEPVSVNVAAHLVGALLIATVSRLPVP
jgi:hypothetical protein